MRTLLTAPRARLGALVLLSLLAIFGVVAFVSASPAQANRNTHAYVRVLHAGADAPAVNIVVDGSTVVTNLSFGHITGYLALQSHTNYDIKVETAAAPNTVVFEIPNASFNATHYTVAAIGLLNPGGTGHGFTVKVFEDYNNNVGSAARVRVVHLSPNAPAVDVWARRVSTNGVYGKAVSDLMYPRATGYLQVAAGQYKFCVAASPSSSAKQCIYTTAQVRLMDDSTYTAWAIGTLGGNFTVLLTADSGEA